MCSRSAGSAGPTVNVTTRDSVRRDPEKGFTGLCIALYLSGAETEALKYIDKIRDRLAIAPSTSDEIDLAIIYAAIGEYEDCVKLMESVYAKRLSVACMGIVWIMRCPCFRGLWSYPPYVQLAKKIGVPALSEIGVV